ncbi:MAG TPA: XdhC family protein [Levilinea sp.]|nr:XdhC family protein [Levilinea sp.]
MSSVFVDLVQLLERGEDGVMAVIFARSGSAPRTAGARMLVRRDGSIAGTIGGGLLEARVMKVAQRVFDTGAAEIKEYELTGADASQTEMICGGEVAVLIELIRANLPAEVAFYRRVALAAPDRRRSWLVTALPAGESAASVAHAMLKPISGRFEQGLEITACSSHNFDLPLDDLSDFVQQAHTTGSRYPQLFRHMQQRLLVEPLGAPGSLYLFGGGHVSQKLAPLADTLGFRIVVIDDRPEYANAERFPQADQFVVISSFTKAVEQCDIDTDAYLVIVTRGHLHDKAVLAQALRTPAVYIGMIGSIRKRNAVYDDLRAEGFTDADFERVHSPVGLKIGSESPEEIAVSIAAELIQVRAGWG